MSCSCGTLTFHLSPPFNHLPRNPNPRYSSKVPASLSPISSSSTSLKISIFGDPRRLQNRPRISPKSSILDLPLLPFESDEVYLRPSPFIPFSPPFPLVESLLWMESMFQHTKTSTRAFVFFFFLTARSDSSDILELVIYLSS